MDTAQGVLASAGIPAKASEIEFTERIKALMKRATPFLEEKKELTGGDLESSLRRQGMPQRVINTLNCMKETKATTAIDSFLETTEEAWCLVLAGPKGCGKSTAAGKYLAETTKPNVKSPPNNIRWWTSSRISRVSGYDTQLEKIMAEKIIVIDDLGVEYLDKNGYFNHRLDELIDERYSNYRKTVITTNLNSGDFQARYGARVADRIREGFKHGGAYIEIELGSLRA